MPAHKTTRPRLTRPAILASFLACLHATDALGAPPAEGSGGAAEPASAPGNTPAPAEPTGLHPIPEYSGDLWTRHALLGDLWGARTDLARAGVQFGVDWNNTFQSVVTGGRNPTTAYGGTLDYNLTFDLMRMGLIPGALVKVRGESRYGESVNADAGPLLPVNADFSFPLAGTPDEGVPLAITTLSYTQFLSETFGLFIGKFDTFDGDANEFASGRGLTQFQNLNLIFNAAPLVTVPYSALGGGAFWKPHPFISISSTVMTASDCSTTSGFDTIGDGWTWASEVQFQYRLGSLPGA